MILFNHFVTGVGWEITGDALNCSNDDLNEKFSGLNKKIFGTVTVLKQGMVQIYPTLNSRKKVHKPFKVVLLLLSPILWGLNHIIESIIGDRAFEIGGGIDFWNFFVGQAIFRKS